MYSSSIYLPELVELVVNVPPYCISTSLSLLVSTRLINNSRWQLKVCILSAVTADVISHLNIRQQSKPYLLLLPQQSIKLEL